MLEQRVPEQEVESCFFGLFLVNRAQWLIDPPCLSDPVFFGVGRTDQTQFLLSNLLFAASCGLCLGGVSEVLALEQVEVVRVLLVQELVLA